MMHQEEKMQIKMQKNVNNEDFCNTGFCIMEDFFLTQPPCGLNRVKNVDRVFTYSFLYFDHSKRH